MIYIQHIANGYLVMRENGPQPTSGPASRKEGVYYAKDHAAVIARVQAILIEPEPPGEPFDPFLESARQLGLKPETLKKAARRQILDAAKDADLMEEHDEAMGEEEDETT